MAIDMTTVKQIMHNNKEVIKIEDGDGRVIWQYTPPEPVTQTLSITVASNGNIKLSNSGLSLIFPSKDAISSYISSNYGEVQSINSVLLKLNTVYWKNQGVSDPYKGMEQPFINSVNSTTSTKPYTYGAVFGSNYSSTRTFSTGTWDITNVIYQSSSRTMYGYRYHKNGQYQSATYTMFNSTYGFKSSSGTTTDISYTIDVNVTYIPN